MERRAHLLLLLAATAAFAGCSADAGSSDDGEGTQDALANLQVLWADAKKLDLTDLEALTAKFAAKEFDDKLQVDNVGGLSIDAPILYASSDVASADAAHQIQSLDDLVSGLASDYGEQELTTQVNAIRLDHVKTTADKYYAESAFTIGQGFGHQWSHTSAGFLGAEIKIGFDDNATLESRTINAFSSDIRGLTGSALKAVADARGFVLPESIDDVMKMKPGESFALKGNGILAANLGGSVPFLIANPTNAIGYSWAISAGVRAALGGDVDVQLVRLKDDEVVVDVGIDGYRVRSWEVAVHDGWGVTGLVKAKVDIGPAKNVDLGSLVDKAVQKRLDDHQTSLSYESASQTQRISVTRLRFHLNRGNKDENEKALAQALHADVRLAEALYNRDLNDPNAGVVVDFDLLRSGVATTRAFGFQIFGMSIYKNVKQTNQGAFTVQTPGGATSILFDSLHKEGGWFSHDHGFTRVGLAGLTFDPKDKKIATGEANLFVQTMQGDSHMSDEYVMDDADALVLAVAGRAALDAIDGPAQKIASMRAQRCPIADDGTIDDACNAQFLVDPQVASLQQAALAALDAKTGGLQQSHRDLVHAAAAARLSVEGVAIGQGGPAASFVSDYRIDDNALGVLATKTSDDFKQSMLGYLTAAQMDRKAFASGSTTRDAVRSRADQKHGGDIDKMGGFFVSEMARYATLRDLENRSIQLNDKDSAVVGPRAIEIRFQVDDGGNVDYANAASDTICHARAEVAAQMFDGLMDRAGHLGSTRLHREHAVAYALLGMLPPSRMDVRMDLKVDGRGSSRFAKSGFASANATSTGTDAKPLSGGLFDLDDVLKTGLPDGDTSDQ